LRQIGAGLNASGLIEDPSAWVITGIVLVLAVTVDSLSRRKRAAVGRA